MLENDTDYLCSLKSLTMRTYAMKARNSKRGGNQAIIIPQIVVMNFNAWARFHIFSLKILTVFSAGIVHPTISSLYL